IHLAGSMHFSVEFHRSGSLAIMRERTIPPDLSRVSRWFVRWLDAPFTTVASPDGRGDQPVVSSKSSRQRRRSQTEKRDGLARHPDGYRIAARGRAQGRSRPHYDL